VIKLCDLGISKRESDITKTKAGTPLYMAPEVLKEEKYDRTADMFSYGILLWEIWYGNRIETKYTVGN
jgi:receptor-interacting serine/threonine-protein kinase 5